RQRHLDRRGRRRGHRPRAPLPLRRPRERARRRGRARGAGGARRRHQPVARGAPMTRPRRLATLAVSLALHATVLLAVALLVAREPELGALFIDLTGGAGGESEAAAVGARDGSGTARAPAPGVPGGVELATAPDAGALALAAPGGGSAGAPGGEYAPYLARLRQRVQASLRYPAAARRRGLQGTVALEIVIRRDGALDAVMLAD